MGDESVNDLLSKVEKDLDLLFSLLMDEHRPIQAGMVEGSRSVLLTVKRMREAA